MASSSAISSSFTSWRPAVSMITMSNPPAEAFSHGGQADGHGVLSCLRGKNMNLQLFPQHLQLFYGSRPVNISSHQQRPPALLAQEIGQFGAGGGFYRRR